MLVALYALITIVPLAWIILTGFKTPPDSISYPPKVLFKPSEEGYCNLFTTRSRQTPEYIAALAAPTGTCDKVARNVDMVIVGPSNYVPRFINSLIIAFGSTVLSVGFGVMAAYAFWRFKIPLKDDLLFFILSTRMMPPIAVAIPIYLMYRELGLSDTRLGMILLYSAVNVSLAVWLLKGSSTRSRELVEHAVGEVWPRNELELHLHFGLRGEVLRELDQRKVMVLSCARAAGLARLSAVAAARANTPGSIFEIDLMRLSPSGLGVQRHTPDDLQ